MLQCGGIAHSMRFVCDQEVWIQWHAPERLNHASIAKALVTRDPTEWLRLSSTFHSFKGFKHLCPSHDLEMLVEPVRQFLLPFACEASWDKNEDSGGRAGITRAEFTQDVARLDRLSETNVISDEQSAFRSVQELEQRLELVREELRSCGGE